MSHRKYIASEGERWDNVAWAAYGDVSLMNELIAANPEVPSFEVLAGGTVLKIPVIVTPVSTTQDKLPPWKQQ